jgi:hypothetical protein
MSKQSIHYRTTGLIGEMKKWIERKRQFDYCN